MRYVLTWLAFACILIAGPVLPRSALADTYLKPIGGKGGGNFAARCSKKEYLVGLDLRTGDDVDAIRPICAHAGKPTEIGQIRVYPKLFGGNGGPHKNPIACVEGAPAVTGMYVEYEGKGTIIVNEIRLFCGVADTAPHGQLAGGKFDGPGGHSNGDFGEADMGEQRCPAGQVAVGLHGRTGRWVDAIGLICDVPHPVIGSLGRGTKNKSNTKVVPVESLPGQKKRPGGAAGAVLKSQNAGGADLVVAGINGPTSLQAGLSGTYTITVQNVGKANSAIDMNIIFAKALNQTGRIVAGAGLDCTVGTDAGINAAITCNGGQLDAGASTTIVVQGRGQSTGAGVLLASVNPSRAIVETSYDNNMKQLNVAIH